MKVKTMKTETCKHGRQEKIPCEHCEHENLLREVEDLRRVVAFRNEQENKAHALFTSPLSNGKFIAHSPDECNPEGFVKRLREEIEGLMLEETNLNNVANYQIQVAQLSAAIKVVREALKGWFVMDSEGYYPDEGHSYTPTLAAIAKQALSLTPPDALKEQLKETIKCLTALGEECKKPFPSFPFMCLIIEKELSRLKGGNDDNT